MSFIVRTGESQTYKIANKKVSAVIFNASLLANAVNVPLVGTDFDPTQNSVNVWLKRESLPGGKSAVFTGTMADLIAGSWNSNWAKLHPKNSSSATIVQAHGAATIERQLFSYKLEFDNVYDLEGTDSLEITLNFNAGSLKGANLVNSSGCTIDIIDLHGDGFETASPQLIINVIKAGEQAVSYNLGNGIRRIMLMNYDKDDILASSAIVNTATLSSDEVSFQKTWDQLMGERDADFIIDASFNEAKRQSFVLYNGENGQLHNARLDLLLNSANVNASVNVLVVWKDEATKETILKAAIKQQGRNAKFLERHGIPTDGRAIKASSAYNNH
jgi:hypothetical protein